MKTILISTVAFPAEEVVDNIGPEPVKLPEASFANPVTVKVLSSDEEQERASVPILLTSQLPAQTTALVVMAIVMAIESFFIFR